MIEVYVKYAGERNCGVKVSSRKTFWEEVVPELKLSVITTKVMAANIY